MLSRVKRHISRHLNNISSWHTDRKIVVIESDDWGSIRMPSKEVYNKCLQAGYCVDDIAYERYDSLASEDDLELLFDVLNKYKDRDGNPAVMTANILAANPDFDKIKSSGFEHYFYELITETFKRYPNHSNNFHLWKQGLKEGVFYPQSHGREHLNVSLFMDALRKGDEDALFGFEHRIPGMIPKDNPKEGNKFVESTRYFSQQDKVEKLSIILEGVDLFEELMGYRSDTFIPPNYYWSPDFDKSMFAKGIRFYQGRRKMMEPLFNGSFKYYHRRLAEENKAGQKYLIRNAFFEPAMVKSGKEPVSSCLKDIAVAFRMKKPAVICSHRLNYVGFIDERNRDENLALLHELLSAITKKWPQVEFLSSAQLGRLFQYNLMSY
ncbi:hypothetical protein CK503_14240 [Aliifodinibius salipaludis]|uniref:Polysaccharide (De)acetylase n=1 Tax=Fodinibius salipaludis TaxID=2032627 RepID=A0A2A2G760_9BACT|nr:hypothetical protein [Aliifodinibius salipaludis]PAU92844.1 hypothetical protein CK503_14240 [Aliifodinibius salipaludis]